jgi:adenylate cyclase
VIEGIAARHGGRVFNTAGDGFMLEFGSSLAAVEAALELAQTCEPKVRIGVHLGDVVVQPNGDLLGHGVNVAARLMAQSTPGGALVSADVRRVIRGPLAERLISRGLLKLDKMTETIEAFALGATPPAAIVAQSHSARASVAVLPFDNLSGDMSLELLADGIVEEILTSLAQFSELVVIARNSTFAYKGRSIDIREVAAKLSVRYVLEGSIRGDANALRIAAQLIDAMSGGHVWAGRFDCKPIDVLKVQDEIAEAIAAKIVPNLVRSEIGRIRRSDCQNLDAWGLAIRAWTDYAAKLTPAAAQEGLVLAQRAVALDPNYGFARVVLACLLCEIGALPITPDAAAARLGAEREAAEALRLSESDPLVLLGVGFVRLRFGKAHDALPLLRRALSLCPNHAYIRSYYALALLLTGHACDSLEHFERAERLSPIDTVLYRLLAFKAVAFFELGRDEEAVAEIARSLSLKSDYAVTLALQATICVAKGSVNEAKEAARAAEISSAVPFLAIVHMLRATISGPNSMPRLSAGFDRAIATLVGP